MSSALKASATIPIVAITDDMVGSGLVRSLANPGGSTTGVSIFATQLDGKRQEVLLELLPSLRRMAALADSNTTGPRELQALQDAARTRGVELLLYRVSKPEEILPAIDAAKRSGAAALNVLATPLLFGNRRIIFERTAARRLPAMYQWPEMAEEGGLVAYGPRIVEIFRELMAREVVKVLRGAKLADLPIEQPTKFLPTLGGHRVSGGLPSSRRRSVIGLEPRLVLHWAGRTPSESGRIWLVKRRRLWLFAILVYVGLDLCLPDMPGAFMFDPDGSVESVDVARTRLTSGVVILLLLVTALLQSSQRQLRDFLHRSPSSNRAAPPVHFMTRYLPRATCAPPPSSEDPH